MAKTEKTLHLRLRPRRNATAGRRYHYNGVLFEEAKGWYIVDEETAHYLATVRENREDDTSPLMFDVCSEEQALAIDRRETNARVRGDAASPLQAKGAQDVTVLGRQRLAADARAKRRASSPLAPVETGDLTTDDLRRGTTTPSKRRPATPARA